MAVDDFVDSFDAGARCAAQPRKKNPPLSSFFAHLVQERDGFFGHRIKIQITKKELADLTLTAPTLSEPCGMWDFLVT